MKRQITLALLAVACALATVAQTTFRYGDNQLKSDSHTWLVNPRATEAEVRSGTVFRTVREAMLAADSIQLTVFDEVFTQERPLSIYITPWVYWMDDPDDPAERRPKRGDSVPFGLKVEMSHTRLIGLSDNAAHTILASNRGQTQGAVGNFTMLHLTGENITFENLTLGNYCNVDLVYEPDTTLNRKRRADAIVQAQLAICHGDRVVARNCRFISRLNTCPLVGARRTFFENCYFECTDDALCGTGVHLNCRFTLFSGKPFYSTQGTGAVFLNCDLHALTEGTQYLTKVGSPVTMVDCRWTSSQPDLQINWTPTPTDDLRCYQHDLTLNGAPLLIDSGRPHLGIGLTGKPLLEAFRLTLPKSLFTMGATGDTVVYNLRNLLGGADDWNPASQPDFLKSCGGKAVGLALNRRKANIETGKEPLTLKATHMKFGERADFSVAATDLRWSVADGSPACVKLEPQEDGSLEVVPDNRGEEPLEAIVVATDPTGLEAACVLTVHPSELPPPAYLRQPTLVREGDTLRVDYELDLQGRADHSLITWHRCTGPNGEGDIRVATSNYPDRPMRTYPLTAADNGYFLRAVVAPKNPRSPVGTITALGFGEAVQTGQTRISRLHTHFEDFSTTRQTAILPGFWTVDAHKPADTEEYDWAPSPFGDPWFFGEGVDGAAGFYGLMQSTRGARLLYTPLEGKYGNMRLTLDVVPCKPAGQGFGSATGQYMDVCIKMDTRTLTGYALRIVRTTRHDRAVEFMLMKYTDGKATPITPSVASNCYRKGCVIRMKVEGDTLSATVKNVLPLPRPTQPDVVREVNLSAPIEANPFGGVGIQHTGSTGASATLLRGLSVRWE